MMRALSIILFFFWVSNIPSQAQSDKKSYFGQKPPSEKPEIFAPGFISTEQFEFSGTFSPDGNEYFFTRRPDYQGSENRIFYSQLINGKWTKPVLAPFAMDVFEFEPVFSPNGKELYFYSNRPENRDDLFDGDLWVACKKKDEWQEPFFFQSPVNKKWCMSVSPSLSGKLFFAGDFNGKRGLFSCEAENGKYINIEYLANEINTINYAHPYISPDETILIMDAQLQSMGKPEIFVSFRQDDGSWCVPINVGSVINSTKTEFAGSLSPDGRFFFFHRRVDGIGNIYWMDAQSIYQLRPTDY